MVSRWVVTSFPEWCGKLRLVGPVKIKGVCRDFGDLSDLVLSDIKRDGG